MGNNQRPTSSTRDIDALRVAFPLSTDSRGKVGSGANLGEYREKQSFGPYLDTWVRHAFGDSASFVSELGLSDLITPGEVDSLRTGEMAPGILLTNLLTVLTPDRNYQYQHIKRWGEEAREKAEAGNIIDIDPERFDKFRQEYLLQQALSVAQRVNETSGENDKKTPETPFWYLFREMVADYAREHSLEVPEEGEMANNLARTIEVNDDLFTISGGVLTGDTGLSPDMHEFVAASLAKQLDGDDLGRNDAIYAAAMEQFVLTTRDRIDADPLYARGQLVATARLFEGMTPDELAKKVGGGDGRSILKTERGTPGIRPSRLVSLEEALNINNQALSLAYFPGNFTAEGRPSEVASDANFGKRRERQSFDKYINGWIQRDFGDDSARFVHELGLSDLITPEQVDSLRTGEKAPGILLTNLLTALTPDRTLQYQHIKRWGEEARQEAEPEDITHIDPERFEKFKQAYLLEQSSSIVSMLDKTSGGNDEKPGTASTAHDRTDIDPLHAHGQLIATARLFGGMTPGELAEKMGSSEDNILKIERGAYGISWQSIKPTEEALNINNQALGRAYFPENFAIEANALDDGITMGALIKARRQNLGISRADLAADLGMGLPSVAAFEAGHYDPPINTFSAIEEILGLEAGLLQRKLHRQLEHRLNSEGSTPAKTLDIYRSVFRVPAPAMAAAFGLKNRPKKGYNPTEESDVAGFAALCGVSLEKIWADVTRSLEPSPSTERRKPTKARETPQERTWVDRTGGEKSTPSTAPRKEESWTALHRPVKPSSGRTPSPTVGRSL